MGLVCRECYWPADAHAGNCPNAPEPEPCPVCGGDCAGDCVGCCERCAAPLIGEGDEIDHCAACAEHAEEV